MAKQEKSTKKKKLKIFAIHHSNGDKDWISAYTNIHALMIYSQYGDIDLVEFDQEDTIDEIPQFFWDDYYIKDEYGSRKETFADYMKREKEPSYIASTNF